MDLLFNTMIVSSFIRKQYFVGFCQCLDEDLMVHVKYTATNRH